MLAREASKLPQSGISTPFSSIKAIIKKKIEDPPLSHPALRDVYRRRIDLRTEQEMTRKEQLVLRQLRSGHCSKLQSYAYSIGKSNSPLCQICKECPDNEQQHWAFCPHLNHPLECRAQSGNLVGATATTTTTTTHSYTGNTFFEVEINTTTTTTTTTLHLITLFTKLSHKLRSLFNSFITSTLNI